MGAHSLITYYSCNLVLLSAFRICEPTRTLMSFVSTSNLMLVTFKSPQIRRLSGIRAYFEVIPEQSKSPLPAPPPATFFLNLILLSDLS